MTLKLTAVLDGEDERIALALMAHYATKHQKKPKATEILRDALQCLAARERVVIRGAKK